jgi:hypothetical protein
MIAVVAHNSILSGAQLVLWLQSSTVAAASARLLGACGTLVWLAHVQALTGADWDCTHAVLLCSLPLPANAPPQLVQELTQCFQLPLQ